MNEDRFLPRKEAAAYLGVSAKTLAVWHLTGRLRGVKLGSGRTSRVVYRIRDLDAWVATLAAQQQPEARDGERG